MKRTYRVMLVQSHVRDVRVEALTPAEALRKVLRKYNYREFQLVRVGGFKDCSAVVTLLQSRVHNVSYYKFVNPVR